ncbi:MAG TPA: SGNH/GDSL hydrolase family protein [Bryobacterales bacterium]|nr:SGNH/GDSL hydrolase family protein [Bryobacterales bacterium]
MSASRKLLYSLATLLVAFLAIEGAARVVWKRLESRAFTERRSRGEALLRNDAVNYLRVADGIYGYALRPGAKVGAVSINGEGFAQRDDVPQARRPGFLRVACLGESTTFGTDADINYPSNLRRILAEHARGFSGYEVINAGVPGWVSDQIALRAEHQLAAFRPDAVILYIGWNDFQSYDPLAGPPGVSYFEHSYGGTKWKQYATSWLKSVALLSALYHTGPVEFQKPEAPIAAAQDNPPEKCYRFLLANLQQIVESFRQASPGVKIFVCTLVGRWPQSTPHQLAHEDPVWWMKRHGVTPEQAAELMARLNNQLRQFARRDGLPLIDAAQTFGDLDRARLQWDWAHMYPDGYELLAWTMYAALRQAGVVEGEPGARQAELAAKYQLERQTQSGKTR